MKHYCREGFNVAWGFVDIDHKSSTTNHVVPRSKSHLQFECARGALFLYLLGYDGANTTGRFVTTQLDKR
jgi:hypothetical protein